MEDKMSNVGLVLSGGGGKGAYQIGVWKALREYGIDNNITAVAGTSVGALNTVLFASGNLEMAEKIWCNLTTDTILSMKNIKETLSDDVKSRVVSLLGINPLKAASVVTYLMSRCEKGIFSRRGLEKIIDEEIDLRVVRNSNLKLYAGCVELPLLNAKYFELNNYDEEKIKSIILASSSLPVIFPPEIIDGMQYIDGGVGGVERNSPVRKLYEQGYRNIIVIYLKQDERIDKSLYPGSQIIEIVPQKDLGTMISGTLDFTAEGASKRIRQGYNDAKSVLEPIYEYHSSRTEKGNEYLKYKETNQEFASEHNASMDRRKEVKDKIKKLW